MKGLQKFSLVLAKLLEVLHWIGVVGMAAACVLSLTAKDYLWTYLVPKFEGEFSTYGIYMEVTGQDISSIMPALTLFSLGGIVVVSLMAMVFRNVYLMLKTVNGTNHHTRRTTPFQHDMVRMLKEIGIFFISLPSVGLVMCIVSGILMGPDLARVGIKLESIITGIFVLCLTQAFSYGMELENDVDGLV